MTPVAGASPEPSPYGFLAGDVRGADAPGVIGGPLEILLLVVVLGVVTAFVTILITRLGRWQVRSDDD